jgi:hypothetical protein
VTIDLNDPAQTKEVYELLTHHYVEDQDASFRFDYSPEFIEWCVCPSCFHFSAPLPCPLASAKLFLARRALKPPSYVPDWHVGIRVASTSGSGEHTQKGKLVGFIAGIPMDLRIRNACVIIPFLPFFSPFPSSPFTPSFFAFSSSTSIHHSLLPHPDFPLPTAPSVRPKSTSSASTKSSVRNASPPSSSKKSPAAPT